MINKKEKFSLNNISFKRHEKKFIGLPPKFFFKFEGKKSKTKIYKDRLIKLNDIGK